MPSDTLNRLYCLYIFHVVVILYCSLYVCPIMVKWPPCNVVVFSYFLHNRVNDTFAIGLKTKQKYIRAQIMAQKRTFSKDDTNASLADFFRDLNVSRHSIKKHNS